VRTIDTVLFDLDDTLHDDTLAYHRAARAVAADIARERGVDADAVFGAYVAEANAFWKKLSAAHLQTPIHDAREQMWYDALLTAGVDDVPLAQRASADYTRYRSGFLELSPGALDLLIALRERGCTIGVVSNGFAATHHEKFDVLGLRPYVDRFFLADEMGMVKPDPAIFTHVCAELGSEPARAAMVGDRYDRDVIGAATAGLFTVLIDVHAIPLPEGAVPPDAVVATIGEVLDVLPGFARQGATAGAPKRPQHERP
jgi:HAD superfamily hydrolase (TIGR01549 family)